MCALGICARTSSAQSLAAHSHIAVFQWLNNSRTAGSSCIASRFGYTCARQQQPVFVRARHAMKDVGVAILTFQSVCGRSGARTPAEVLRSQPPRAKY